MATTASKKKRAKAKKAKAAPAPANPNGGLDQSALTKGEIRKLNALKKSVGDTLGEKTFEQWLQKKSKQIGADPGHKNADLIADTIMGLIESKGIRLPRGGYLITRGRGRVIVETAKS